MGNLCSTRPQVGQCEKIDTLPPFVPYSCRLEIIGGPGVGKKTFLDKFMDPTLGDYVTEFQITHAKREFRGETKLLKFGHYDEFADGIIAMYSLDNLQSFIGLVEQVNNLKDDIPVLMVGNKEDIIDGENRETPKEIDRLLEKLPKKVEKRLMQRTDLDWVEISALSGDGMERVIEILADLIFFKQTRMIYIKPTRRGGGGKGGRKGGRGEKEEKEEKEVNDEEKGDEKDKNRDKEEKDEEKKGEKEVNDEGKGDEKDKNRDKEEKEEEKKGENEEEEGGGKGGNEEDKGEKGEE